MEHSLTNLQRQHSFSFDPAPNNESHDYAYYRLWAYYNEDDYVTSDKFHADYSAFGFSTQPQNAQLNRTTRAADISWATNFTPKKVQLVTSKELIDYSKVVKTYNAPPRIVANWNVSAEAKPYELRAFCGSGKNDYVDSTIFWVIDPGYIFTGTPQDAVLPPTQTVWQVSWQTNFTPLRTVITRDPDGDSPVTVFDSITASSCGLPVAELDSAVFRLTVYHETEGWYSDHITHDFSMIRSAFTTQPQSCTHLAGGSRSVSWATSFAPLRVTLVRIPEAGDAVTVKTLAGSATGTDAQTASGEDRTQYCVRAWWGSGTNDYVSSEPFWVFRLRFVTQPEGGHAPSADTACPVSWKTSFVPSGFDSLALRDGSYVPVTNPNLLTTRNDGSASTALLPHIGWRLGTTYVVRAYAFDGLYVDSEPFTIVNPVLFRVFFHMNGATGTAPGAQDVIYGETAVQPEDPLSAGRAFLGWHTEPEALNAYDFSTPSTTR